MANLTPLHEEVSTGSMKLPVYLDHHATTPADPEVLEAMLPYFRERFGNAASQQHLVGWEAAAAVTLAREQVATLIGEEPQEIIFTSGATESINLALIGAMQARAPRGGHLITVATEHKAVLATAQYLQTLGHRITILPVNGYGELDLQGLKESITKETVLVSVMAANNEIGTLHPLQEIGVITREQEVWLHVDGAQAVGKIPMDMNSLHIDLLSFSGHKIYGPKGIGALYMRRRSPRVRLLPLLHGGGQEQGLRSGTLNVPAIVGLGRALELAGTRMSHDGEPVGALRDRLAQGLKAGIPDLVINGHPQKRLYHNLHVSFPGVEGAALLMELRDVAVSSDAACTTSSQDPGKISHVLAAIGMDPKLAQSSLRFGLGRGNTEEEIDFVIGKVVAAVKKLQNPSPT